MNKINPYANHDFDASYKNIYLVFIFEIFTKLKSILNFKNKVSIESYIERIFFYF